MQRLKLVLQTQFLNRHCILAEGKAASFAAGKPTSNRGNRREPMPSNTLHPSLDDGDKMLHWGTALPILFSAQEGLRKGPAFRVLELMYYLSKKLPGEKTQLC